MTDSPPPRPRTPVCGIGASAGGLEALQELFTALPDDIGLAYVVIVHLAPDYKSELPAILRRWTTMPVVQVADHDKAPIVPNHVYVIAPDRKLEISDSMIGASAFEQPLGRRNAIDLFFRSLALEHGDGFALVLSGAGSDGAVGAKAVKESGGLVLVQDPTEAAHGDMPRAVIATGVADLVLPLRELARRLPELARVKDRLKSLEQRVAAPPERVEPLPSEEEKSLKGVLDILRKRTGNDFSRYKRSTILRRLSRRMQLVHQVTIGEYLKYVRIHPAEVTALLDDLLISVTTFFRDPDAWAALTTQVIAPLLARTDGDDPIRAWVAGCATGEEAYTVAMLLDEECARRGKEASFLVFATDLDESALAVARAGIYPRAISTDISDARLAQYFVREDDYYRVASTLRERLVFASHSVLRDPPFSKLHLVACRNLLIYLDRDLQEQLMGIFRYACRDDGYLFLGISETAAEELFVAIDRKHRIYGARPRPEGVRPQLPEVLSAPSGRLVRYGREIVPTPKSSPAEVHLAALEEVAPPSVVVDDRGHVLHLSATAARFLQQGAGTPARRLIDLVRPALRDELHALLQRAFDTSTPQLSSFVRVPFNGAAHRIAVLAQRRMRGDGDAGREAVLVTFLDAGPARAELPAIADQEPSGELVRTLREKLREAEQRIESVRDEQRLTHEDLRAANEELQSLNEEYRSTTEELETSKEELQSINEELQTLNLELKAKLEEVSRAHNDLENLMSATNVATLFLNTELRIKRFTPQLGDIFSIRLRDLDRPIGDLTHSLDYTTLEQDARGVLTTFVPVEQETASRNGRTYIVRLYPYRTLGGRDIDGVVITFIDITAIKQAEAALRESERRLDVELHVMRRLHQMTLVVAIARSMNEALDEVLSTAIDLHHADLGNMQLFDPDTGSLRIVAQRGFRPSFLDEFATVDGVDETACGRALRTRELVQLPDVEMDAAYAPYRRAAADAGYRAVQSMPLIDRTGTLMGVLSVHFRDPHVFSERDRQLADMLGQQAADLIASRVQQDRLRDLNQTLIQRTHDLEHSQDQLSRQAADLVQQDRNRQEFLAALGHELRNPMAAMTSGLSLVSVSDDRSRRALAVLRRQTTHMARLINDLLDISRVKHGRLRLDRVPVDANVCVLAAAETVRPQAEAKGLTVACTLPPEPLFVDADPERLAQILDNLLRNAVTYSERGAITLEVGQTPALAQFSVRDAGIGLEPEDLSWIFEPYHQRRGGTRNVGLGLGLTLVKGLVEAHGGTVRVHSDGRGRGTEFTFTIPLAHAMPAAGTTGVPAVSEARRILVVDDQADVADMFAALLETLGQDVRVAYDGSSAVSAARTHRPQVAFLDISMPEISGPELARRLRQEFPRDELTLVALTGHEKDNTGAEDGLFDHHLLKPASPEAVATLLNELMAARR